MTFRIDVVKEESDDQYEAPVDGHQPSLATPRSKAKVSFSNTDQIFEIPGIVNTTPKQKTKHLQVGTPRSSGLSPKASILKQPSTPTPETRALNKSTLFALNNPEKKVRQDAYSFILKTIEYFGKIYSHDMATLNQIARHNAFYTADLIELIQRLAQDRTQITNTGCCFRKSKPEPKHPEFFHYMLFLSKLSTDLTVLSQVKSEFTNQFPHVEIHQPDTVVDEQKEHKPLAKASSSK